MKSLKLKGIFTLFFIFVVVLALLPVLGGYELEVIVGLAINLLIVVSFRFITTSGRWSFAHVQLAGLGGYTSAILVRTFGWSFWFSSLAGGLVAALVGLIISYPCLKTRGFYFFMSTYVAGAVIAWSWTKFVVPFGGTTGLSPIPRPDPISIGGLLTLNFDSRLVYTYLVVVAVLLCVVILYLLEKSRLGTILKSMDSNVSLAKSVGINILGYEILSFVIGCFFAGIAGVLSIHDTGLAYALDWSSTRGMVVLVFCLVGGIGSFWGPPLGLLFLTVISEAIRGYTEFIPMIYGVFMIATVLVLPEGLVSLPRRMSPLLNRMMRLVPKRNEE